MKLSISALEHTSVKLPNGGEIIVLNDGAVINAEARAMLQALHSRSTGGLRSHLEVLAKRGPDNFMKNFYVGYGHKSIGDCGDTTLFIEGVSMLAAKAVQDSQLYSGQESSTRYIDFSNQPFINPTSTKEGGELLERQRAFYLAAQEPTRQRLEDLHPKKEGEDNEVYKKAINARTFDITRSLLPAGAATNLSYHTNLRQAADRVLWLRHHPLEEVKKIGEGLEEALRRHHPNSFAHKKYQDTEDYQDLIAQNYLFHDLGSPTEPLIDFQRLDFDELERFRDLLGRRPSKTEMPKFLAQVGSLRAKYILDFGSFRDIQRHRAIVQRMPLLTTDLGFNQWYLDNLPQEVADRLPKHLEEVRNGIKGLGTSREASQYFIPMGFNTSNQFVGDLPATVYMVELRGKSDVHPTLQRVAVSMGDQISSKLQIPVYTQRDFGRFDLKRGTQDIILR